MTTLRLPARIKRTVAVVVAVLAAGTLVFGPPFSSSSSPAPVRPPATVAVYDTAGYHDEVTGAFIYSLVRSGRTPDVYIRDKGFRFGMDEIVQEFYPWPVKQAGKDKAEIVQRILANELELVVLSTCVKGLPPLLDALSAPGVQTRVACTIHHSGEMKKYWDLLAPLAQEGRLTMLGLGEHVVRAFSKNLELKAFKDDDPAWTTVGRQAFAPVFPADIVEKTRATYTRGRFFPSDVAIQGNIQQSRRDYKGIFKQILKHFADDAATWGYSFDEDLGKYVALPDDGVNPPPFHLHLLGNPGPTFVLPTELEDVALIHARMSYAEYFALLATCDLLLPAFANKGYLTSTASSSIGAAVISRVPILGEPSLSEAYTYLGAPAQADQPTDEPVIDTLRAMRDASLAGELAHAGPAVEMAEWTDLLERLYDDNDRLWDDLLARPLVDASSLPKPSLLAADGPVGPSAEQLALEAEDEAEAAGEEKRAAVRTADGRGAA